MILTILYGSQSGTAERLAEVVTRLALYRGVEGVRCLPADDIPVSEWPRYTPVVWLLSNASQGEAPDTARHSWAALRQPSAPSLTGLKYAIFGLGDSIYPKFNFMAKMAHNRLKQLGGEPLVHRGLGDESDANGHEETLVSWLMGLWDALGLLKRAREEDGTLVARTRESLLSGRLLCKYSVEVLTPPLSHSTGRSDTSDRDLPRTAASPVFSTTVVSNTRLTSQSHFQRVHHVELARPASLAYDAGDALGVYCANSDTAVTALLTLLGFKCDADQPSVLVLPNAASGIVQQAHQPFFGKPITLRTILKHYMDLEAPASRNFLWMLSTFAPSGSEEQERLAELAAEDHMDDYLTYAYREKRNVIEVLSDFSTLRPTLEAVLSFTEPMRPRLFSLSSSPALDAKVLALTVAQLEWTTPYKRTRKGMCSTMLCDAAIGSEIQCFLWPGTLCAPLDGSVPLVFIATGTGIAPIRSCVRQLMSTARADATPTTETVKAGRDPVTPPMYLFFGCRNREKDYLYADEWKAYVPLHVFPAFSRDGEKKCYVQHQLGNHAREVGKLMGEGGATFIVCGNAKQMPKDVEATLRQIATQCCCGGDEERGELLWKSLYREGRFQVDTWSS